MSHHNSLYSFIMFTSYALQPKSVHYHVAEQNVSHSRLRVFFLVQIGISLYQAAHNTKALFLLRDTEY